MSSEAMARRPGEKGIAETAGPASNQSGSGGHDLEDGPQMVDVDRIEKVYRLVSRFHCVRAGSDKQQQARSKNFARYFCTSMMAKHFLI